MKRINPEAVAAWFKAHPDIKPTRENFVVLDKSWEKLVGCCVLTSIVIGPQSTMDMQEMLDLQGVSTNWGADVLGREIGLPFDYALGVAHGWDGWKHVMKDSNEYFAGHDDGKAAWQATQEALNS